MVKVSGLDIYLWKYGLNGDLSDLNVNKMSKEMLFLPFLMTSNIRLVLNTPEYENDIDIGCRICHGL